MSQQNAKTLQSPRRDSRSPFEMVGASRHPSQISPAAQKYSFMTAISELEQFRSANEEIFLKRLKDADAEIGMLQHKLKLTFTDLDSKLNRVIQKHELDYNEAYKIMLQRKERDLQVLIEKVREKIAQDMFKDEKIKKLEQQISFIRAEAIRLDKSCKALRDETAKYRSQLDVMNTDNAFLKEQVLDLNKQNKALKYSMTRLQDQYKDLAKATTQASVIQQEVDKRTDLIDNILKTENLDLTQTIDEVNQSTNLGTPSGLKQIRFSQKKQKLETVGSMEQGASHKAASAVFQTIVLNQDQSLAEKARSVEEDILGRRTSLTTLEDQKVIGKESQRDMLYKNKMAESPSIQQIRQESVSITQGISAPRRSVVAPVQNVKFRAVLNMLLDAQVTRPELEEELQNFVNSMEKRMNDRVDFMRQRLEAEKRKVQQLKGKVPAAQALQKNEYEMLFFECVESVRREVSKRKLKGDILNKRIFMNQLKATHRSVAEHSATAIVKDQSVLEKMAKLEDLTETDRMRVLDMFVNNEKIVAQLFDLIFPSKPLKEDIIKAKDTKTPSKYYLMEDLTAFLDSPAEPINTRRSKPNFSNPKVSQSIEAINQSGRSMHASPLIGAGGGMVHPTQFPPQKRPFRPISYSQNQSFPEVSASTPQRERGVGTNRSVSYITNPLDLEAVGKEMTRKKIKPNVYLKSGLIAAMANHRRSLSKQEPKAPSLFSQ